MQNNKEVCNILKDQITLRYNLNQTIKHYLRSLNFICQRNIENEYGYYILEKDKKLYKFYKAFVESYISSNNLYSDGYCKIVFVFLKCSDNPDDLKKIRKLKRIWKKDIPLFSFDKDPVNLVFRYDFNLNILFNEAISLNVKFKGYKIIQTQKNVRLDILKEDYIVNPFLYK